MTSPQRRRATSHLQPSPLPQRIRSVYTETTTNRWTSLRRQHQTHLFEPRCRDHACASPTHIDSSFNRLGIIALLLVRETPVQTLASTHHSRDPLAHPHSTGNGLWEPSALEQYHRSESSVQPLPILRRKKQWSSSHGIAIGVYE
ncbi:hypothetical protein M422DRAFT_33586 [Sphaerobolus stellatus SS14]|uniref:Uncharacterized protein n=1 Tax=Sphaerobolus stellatus (strain SS14) TaxID=990650 RepID=A0A0C9VJ75_SPHS4|nr:hypothetical protein M422DRAFT_33586 [Sphaerobolus stellatus SS14]